MAKRRPSGDGMVRKRDDGRWEGRIVVGHKGKRRLDLPLCIREDAKGSDGKRCIGALSSMTVPNLRRTAA